LIRVSSGRGFVVGIAAPWSVDTTTGLVTFSTAPASGVERTAIRSDAGFAVDNLDLVGVFAEGGTGTFATAGGGAETFAAGDRLSIINEDPADATLADLSITFLGKRT
jgi:hypothetical protein